VIKDHLIYRTLVSAVPLPAQTLLLDVRESVNGAPLPPPLPSWDGLESRLFDEGFIVFDVASSPAAPDQGELTRLARTAGADLILVVTVEYAETAIGIELVRSTGRATYVLTDAGTGTVRASGKEQASNRDRERDVDRQALGREIGKLVGGRVATALNALAPPR
jgi:hypothetical protein